MTDYQKLAAENIQVVNPRDLSELFQQIKKHRICVYLDILFGVLKLFYSVMYEFARRQLNLPPTKEEKELAAEFYEWIREKFEVKSTQSWAKIIFFYSQDERDALDRFFNLFEQRTKNKQKNV